VLRDQADVIDEIGKKSRNDPAIAMLDPGADRGSFRRTASCGVEAAPTLVAEPGGCPGCRATRAATHWVPVLPFPPTVSPHAESTPGGPGCGNGQLIERTGC
jgi:hypothetical protein